MKHPQAFVTLLLASAVGFAVALWSGSLWVALGVLISGFTLAFVVSMAWLWSPRSGINSKRKPSSDSLSGLR
jgi:high-affinity Fe2+/Pb2+ permease